VDIPTIWLLVASIATPVAGVVGFAIQLRQVRKTRLENEKLQLEIATLKAAEAARSQRILQVTTEEVLRYAREQPPLLSQGRGPNPGPDFSDEPSSALGGYLAIGALLLFVVMIIGYAIYDIIRLFRWFANAL